LPIWPARGAVTEDHLTHRERRSHGHHSHLHGIRRQVSLRGDPSALRIPGDRSGSAELIPGSEITIRRFEASRSNPWHHAPGRFAVFTLSGAVDIEIGGA